MHAIVHQLVKWIHITWFNKIKGIHIFLSSKFSLQFAVLDKEFLIAQFSLVESEIAEKWITVNHDRAVLFMSGTGTDSFQIYKEFVFHYCTNVFCQSVFLKQRRCSIEYLLHIDLSFSYLHWYFVVTTDHKYLTKNSPNKENARTFIIGSWINHWKCNKYLKLNIKTINWLITNQLKFTICTVCVL